MTSRHIRVSPLSQKDWGDEQWQILAALAEDLPPDFQGGQKEDTDYTGVEILLNHPSLARSYLSYSQWLLGKNELSNYDRELIILRVGYLAKCEYEWTQHVLVAEYEGMADEVIRRVKAGSEHPDWNEKERYLLSSVDELLASSYISDANWSGLTGYYNTHQLMEIIFTAGNYYQMAMLYNSMGAPLNDNLKAALSRCPLD